MLSFVSFQVYYLLNFSTCLLLAENYLLCFVGAENVVQVVTDNASNNMGAKVMLKDKRPKLFWTSCATHTINLMVEAVAKLKHFGSTITKAKEMTTFLYAHHTTLALMRSYTKKRDIVRPGVTRFASAFLTLQSLDAKRKQLKEMCCSDTWEGCKHTRTKKGQVAHAAIMSRAFWKNVSLCIKVLFTKLQIVLVYVGMHVYMLNANVVHLCLGMFETWNGTFLSHW